MSSLICCWRSTVAAGDGYTMQQGLDPSQILYNFKPKQQHIGFHAIKTSETTRPVQTAKNSFTLHLPQYFSYHNVVVHTACITRIDVTTSCLTQQPILYPFHIEPSSTSLIRSSHPHPAPSLQSPYSSLAPSADLPLLPDQMAVGPVTDLSSPSVFYVPPSWNQKGCCLFWFDRVLPELCLLYGSVVVSVRVGCEYGLRF